MCQQSMCSHAGGAQLGYSAICACAPGRAQLHVVGWADLQDPHALRKTLHRLRPAAALPALMLCQDVSLCLRTHFRQVVDGVPHDQGRLMLASGSLMIMNALIAEPYFMLGCLASVRTLCEPWITARCRGLQHCWAMHSSAIPSLLLIAFIVVYRLAQRCEALV